MGCADILGTQTATFAAAKFTSIYTTCDSMVVFRERSDGDMGIVVGATAKNGQTEPLTYDHKWYLGGHLCYDGTDDSCDGTYDPTQAFYSFPYLCSETLRAGCAKGDYTKKFGPMNCPGVKSVSDDSMTVAEVTG